jgi:hypothetical protein
VELSSLRRLSALLVVGLPLAASACSGTGDGGTGDLPSEPVGDAYGNGRPLDELFGEADWYDPTNAASIDCGSPNPRRTQLTGLTIIAVDTYDEVNDNRKGNIYAVQTPGKKGLQPYDAITLRTPSFTPPDLRVFPGEVVDASGNFVEFLGPPSSLFGYCETLPQIEGTVTYRFDGGDIAPYPLVPASTADGSDRWAVLKSYEAARPFIGMLVRLENVKFNERREGVNGDVTFPINVAEQGSVLQSDVPGVSNELYDILGTGPAIPDGSTVASVTGILTYFYGFKIAPRGPSDIVREAPVDPSTSASSGGQLD